MNNLLETNLETSTSTLIQAKPDKQAFIAYAGAYRLLPVSITLKNDTLTPISIFQRLRTMSECFLLESADGNEKQARYSIIGKDPLIVFKSRERDFSITINGRDYAQDYAEEPIAAIRKLLQQFRMPCELAADGYRCGLTGYFSYDFVRCLEDISDANPDDTGLPDCDLMAPRQVVVYDHLRHEITLICNVLISDDYESMLSGRKYDEAVSVLSIMKQQIFSLADSISTEHFKVGSADFCSNMNRDEYMSIVERAKKYIRAGDIFQAVLSQRFSTTFTGDAFEIYRSLRNVSPSPYLFFLQFENACLAGASPEMLVRLSNGLVETSPIAGTRKRGADAQEDDRLATELLADKKEMSEHAMLTDLARNDIGRICSFGSVNVTKYAAVENFSHVMHIVSKVEGQLAADKSAIDVLCALLPAGTLSGAPKIRAMNIIDELENTRRGPYGGAAGYLSFDGSMNTCITIRTALITQGRLHIQAGAGIVADSVPESEYNECVSKAAAMIAAIEQAGNFI